jgi:putative transposase
MGCEVFNWGLERRIDYYTKTGKSLSFAKQCKELTKERKKRIPWQYVHTHVLQLALKRLDLAFDSFFRRLKLGEKPGFPRFKSQKRFSGFGFKEYGNGWKIEVRETNKGKKDKGHKGKRNRTKVKQIVKHIYLSNIGWLQLRGNERVQGGVPTTCELIKRAGKWYVSVTYTYDKELLKRERLGDKLSGLDWGIENLATVSNNDRTDEITENPRHLRNSLEKLAKLQQELSRKKLGSVRRELAKLEVAKLHNHIRNQRKDYMHKVTSELVNDRAGIAVEKLSPKNMSAKGGAYKSGLNREILAAAAGQFHQMLGYKAEEAGCIILEVDPKIHKPSQTCSGGGLVRKRVWEKEHMYCLMVQ